MAEDSILLIPKNSVVISIKSSFILIFAVIIEENDNII